MSRRSITTLVLATLLLYAWPMWRWVSCREPRVATFSLASPSAPDDRNSPHMIGEFISHGSESEMVHVASICEMPNGRLAASWYGGTREGARDTVVYVAVRDPGQSSWSTPRVVVDRVSASRELRRYVKKVGNPLIFADSENRLWLLYVTITIGGWSGSSLNVKISYDGGMNWSGSRRLTLSPFFNVSELVRNNAVPMSGGSFAIPIYHECVGKFPEILWIRLSGETFRFRKTRMAGGRTFTQPTIVPYEARGAIALYRNCSGKRAVGMATTRDAGDTWSEPHTIGLPNPDSGLNALLLTEGRILLAFNDSPTDRENLQLAVSYDKGAKWLRVGRIEEGPGDEFSYPYMIVGRDRCIHLVYTWRRKRIKHVVFNEHWINATLRGASQ
jgi:predicted neuraminidase